MSEDIEENRTEVEDKTCDNDSVGTGRIRIVKAVRGSEKNDGEREKEEVNFRTDDSMDSTDGNISDSWTDRVGKIADELDKEEDLSSDSYVDWAYKVMDWLKVAVKARAWRDIENHAEEIITAFMVLVKEEHRGIILDVLKTLREVV